MTNQTTKHTGAWVSFTYAQAFLALGMTAAGLLFMPIDLWMKGYFLMGIVMTISATVTLTKTLRDNEESAKLMNKIEDAKTEQLLMRIDRNKE